MLLLLLRLFELALLRILLLPPSKAVAVLPSETCGGGGKTTKGVGVALSQSLVLLITAADHESCIGLERMEQVGEDELEIE